MNMKKYIPYLISITKRCKKYLTFTFIIYFAHTVVTIYFNLQ